ncbi:multiple C2 and transmembrane domain-containing protein isoform X2 [Manduca sexta]|uniref:multiple C2 and transmembrane domain-containing protein isoform X2 n=1 Tax=Manduca sexta TaxID=7130 RepID=UPI0011837632|nr:multiple C2 and transmembrane domain-containing protein isoform X2 [Manduca sexta]
MWSLAIPDGLVMDPLAPNALAVSNDLMERLGSGLSILREHGKKVQKYVWKNRKFDILKKSWKSIVNVVLIEAKDLPNSPASGTNGLYCKFRLGNEAHKSKQATKSKPMWCERFNLYLYEDSRLEVTVWHKAKQKNFMGRCVIDLCQLEKEKTHDIWQELECGFGSLHMLITLSGTARELTVDNVPTTNGAHHPTPPTEEYSWYRLNNDWSEVGQLSVTVYGARGLSPLGLGGKADAYCVLELDNSRVQTHTIRGAAEPMWNKSYTFDVNDITSTLDIKVYDESIIGETLGKISIPLLRINNNEKKWYALKDKSKKSNAKGNCPRILLQMSVAWNPIKASLRLLSPKETKYVQKAPNKFNIPLLYSNLKFIRDIFHAVHTGNEHFKYLFEWDNQEKSALALIAWLTFWFFFRMWMTPLLVLVPFIYFWVGHRNHSNNLISVYPSEDEASEDDLESTKDELTIKTRLYGLQDLTFTIKGGIDYIVSLLERIKNLMNFTIPYLSYLVMVAMVALSAALYLIPVNYLFMAFGLYKFMRKFLNPDRIPNNDILDFISRIPDDKTLKQWQELKVPEPNLNRTLSSAGR